MKSIPAEIPDVLVFEPRLFSDARGYFLEVYNERSFAALGLTETFVQDNQSHSKTFQANSHLIANTNFPYNKVLLDDALQWQFSCRRVAIIEKHKHSH